MADECIFCKISKGEIPASRVYEDDLVVAFLDIAPLSDGHCLVIPKEHYEYLDECPADTADAVISKIGPIAKAIVSATGAAGYNVLNNNGRCAGQLVGHVHFHIIPRNADDGLFSQWPSKQYPQGRAEELVQAIKDHLE